MYFGVSGKATRGWYYIIMLASFPNVPKTYSVRKSWKSTFLITPLSFGAPFPWNPVGISAQTLYCQNLQSSSSLTRWFYLHSNFRGGGLVGSERRTCFDTQCVMALQGHQRSVILAPIESAYAISYWSSIVTLVLWCPVSEILQVSWENDPTPIPPEF